MASEKDKYLRHIPNILSCLRLCMVPLFVVLFFNEAIHRAIPVTVFVVAGVTDVIDGYLARRNGWVTRMGKIIDPVADKAMQLAVLISLVVADSFKWWMILPFVIKELATIIGGAIIIRNRNFVTISRFYGKAAVVMFYVTCGLNILMPRFRLEQPVWFWITLALTVFLAVFAISWYAVDYARFLKKEKKEPADKTSQEDGTTIENEQEV